MTSPQPSIINLANRPYIEPTEAYTQAELSLTQRLWHANQDADSPDEIHVPVHNPFCETCGQLISQMRQHKSPKSLEYGSMHDLSQSALKCPLCAYFKASFYLGLLGGLIQQHQRNARDAVDVQGPAPISTEGVDDVISVHDYTADRNMHFGIRWFHAIWRAKGKDKFRWLGAMVGINTLPEYENIAVWTSPDPMDHDGRIRRLKSWMDQCKKEHMRCREDPPVMPTRVIDLGPPDEPMKVRLISTGGRTGEYVALSYRRGESTSLQTTKDTLSERMDNIEFSSDEVLFQEVADVAKKLGVRYLWIDVLCIIQDDEDDWSREIERMNDTFGNAHVTFQASAANTTSENLWTPYVVSYPTAESDVKIRIPTEHSPSKPSTLANHAWALQEDFLSWRIVSFDSTQLRWRCRSDEDYEDGSASHFHEDWRPSTILGQWKKDPSEWFLNPTMRPISYSPLPKDENYLRDRFLYSVWESFVEQYSEPQVPHEKDKLPAIAGMTSYFKEKINDEFLLGLWKRRFAAGLCWRVDPHEAKRSPIEGFPSWSWASMVGAVSYHTLMPKEIHKLGNPFWHVFPRAVLEEAIVKPEANKIKEGTLVISARFLIVRLEQGDSLSIVVEATNKSIGSAWLDERDCVVQGIHFMEVATVETDGRRDLYLGLLVVPIDATGTRFRRIGLGSCKETSGIEWIFDQLEPWEGAFTHTVSLV